MPPGQTVRYATGVVVVLAALLLVSGCGSEQLALVGRPSDSPTPAPVTVPAAVTAPAGASASAGPAPVFAPAPDARTRTAEGPLAVAVVPSSSTTSPTDAPSATRSATSSPRSATSTATPSRSAAPAAAPSRSTAPPSPAPSPVAGPALRIVSAHIPYPQTRLQEMATYSLRHYGSSSWQLSPSVIVLHYTAGSTADGAISTFSADTPNLGELPGTCAHYLVDKDGTVLELVPPTIRCRHTVGLNDSAIGIEMVQEGGSGASWADRQILDRPAQIGAAVALVRSLQSRYGISTGNVIGHATANAAPQFHDLLGWRNDHSDWQAADVAEFRSRL